MAKCFPDPSKYIVDLDKPDQLLYIIEVCDFKTKVINDVYISMCIHHTDLFYSKYNLSNRIYIGPTSTDYQLAFLMCNQAQVKPGDLVYDPFMGAGTILISCSHFNAFCIGSDLDMRVLRGEGIGMINKALADKYTKCNMLTNFNEYKLPYPDFFRMDITYPCLLPLEIFDAVLCDPPYGIRAMARKLGKRSKKE